MSLRSIGFADANGEHSVMHLGGDSVVIHRHWQRQRPSERSGQTLPRMHDFAGSSRLFGASAGDGRVAPIKYRPD